MTPRAVLDATAAPRTSSLAAAAAGAPAAMVILLGSVGNCVAPAASMVQVPPTIPGHGAE